MSYNQNPYGQPNPYNEGPSAEGGYGGSYGDGNYGGGYDNNGYGQQPESHEMQTYPHEQRQPHGPDATATGTPLSQQEFLNSVRDVEGHIQQFRSNLDQIRTLHQQSLSDTSGRPPPGLEQLQAVTEQLKSQIKSEVDNLVSDATRTGDSTFNTKKRQAERLRDLYKDAIQAYLVEERRHKGQIGEQAVRQLLIVNPDATPQEQDAVRSGDLQQDQIFQSALLQSNRVGAAKAVLGNVQARHQELLRVEQSMQELAQLFEYLNTLIVQQGEVIADVVQKTEQVNDNMDKGIQEVDKGVKHARNRRKLKWYCLLVCVLIIIAIALGVGLGLEVRWWFGR
ncbi:hypothetical protein SMACR_07823 [Sordaria macrospora]|uniref:t-SNARE coiled-coil homology domain-containing protein n=1 Tax=Sordaria macrospora TaxID=5147 RepID=A0A8S8ZLB6_SORMA|nr:hypothetical protein SMACR_07823 [Sordaria macrospora]WPJ59821.1 hypothetical protein SMAC4_07823 [Sordaria macrospora]